MNVHSTVVGAIRSSPLARYAQAVAVAGLAVLVRLALDPVWGIKLPFITLFPAIMLSAWLGGFRPGLVTTAIGAAAATYFWLEPARSWAVTERSELLGVLVFVAVGVMISALNEAWRQAATGFSQSAERLRITLLGIGDAVITTDNQGRVTGLNPVAERLTGWSDADAVGQPLTNVFVIVNEHSRTPSENPVPRVLREGLIAGLANHTVLVARDGREIPIDDSAAPIRSADGTVVGAVLIFRDITERRRSERDRSMLLEKERAARLEAEHVSEDLLHLQGVTDIALTSLEPAAQMRELLERVCLALKCDTATVLLLDGDGGHLTPVASYGLGERRDHSTPTPYGQDIAGRIAATRQGMIVDDLDDVEVVDPFLRNHVKSLMGTPLQVGERVVGVIHVGTVAPRRFTQGDLRLLSLVADRLALTLQRTRLQEEERAARVEVATAMEQLRLALEAGHMGTWQYTIATGDVTWSPGLEAIHGLGPGSFPGTFDAFRDEIYPVDRDRVLEAIGAAVEQRSDHHIEYRIVRADGSVRWVEGRGQLFCDKDGHPERLVGVCSDITERKESEERFRLAVEAAPTAMLVVNPDGRVVLVNRLTEQLFGYERDELLGRAVEELVPPRFRSQHVGYRAGFFRAARQRPMGVGRDLYARRKDGTEVPVEIGLSPMETAEGISVIAAVTDISERKQAEAALRSAKQEAEIANQLKDQFLATVSHELRAPLNAVVGWAEMLRTGRLDENRRQRALEAVLTNAKRQARLIDDLLDVSRTVSGQLALTRSALELHTVARAALDAIQPSAEAKGIRIQTDIDPSIGSVLADAARLQQILVNLLTNAVKFTGDNGTVALTIRRAANVVEMIVSDTGRGITSDFLPWVFEPFRQADRSTTRTHGGLGLGLAIVKHLAEAHGGSVAADSAGEGHGATFTVRLPIVAVYGEEAEAAALPSSSGVGPVTGTVRSLDGMTILVVDDDADSRDLVTAVLESAKASVLTAASAAEALEILQREPVNVLLADIAMPDGDGYGLVQRLREREPPLNTIPAVALTSFAGHDDRHRALEAGFQIHLGKPVESRTLIETVASLVQRAPSS